MEIKILGSGCAKCRKLYEEAEKAIMETGIQATLIKVEKIDEIISHGVMMTPALLLDGEIKISGRTANAGQIAEWIRRKNDPGC